MRSTNVPALVATAFCLLSSSPAWTSGREFYIAVETVEVRSAPALDARVVAELKRGDKVVEFARRGDWIKIGVYRAVGKEGWIQGTAVVAIPRERAPDPPQVPAIELTIPFELSVGGSPARKFRGTCRLLNAEQVIETVEFEGITPSRFNIEAGAASCIVQKWDARGRLRVELLGGRHLLAAAETAAVFNWVRVRSDGPWGNRGGRRGLVRAPIVTPSLSRTIPSL